MGQNVKPTTSVISFSGGEEVSVKFTFQHEHNFFQLIMFDNGC